MKNILPLRLLPLALLVTVQHAAAQAAPTLTIRRDAARDEVVLEVGPADVPAGGEHVQLPALQAPIPADGWVHGYTVELVDGRGRAVPRATLHHLNVITPGQRELFSPIMLRVAAAGQETAPVELPRALGYRVRRGQPLIVTAMLHDPAGHGYRGVRLRLRMPFTPGDALIKPISAFPFYLDVMPPASLHSYDLPPGKSTRNWQGSPGAAARILAMGGHLHEYGDSLRMEDLTTHRVISRLRPVVGRTGEVEAMETQYFMWRLGIAVRPDHVYRVTAYYTNPTGRPIPGGAMGVMGGILVASADEWPPYDASLPEARLDWRLVHTGYSGAHGGHMHAMKPAPRPAQPSMAGEMQGMDMDHDAHQH